MPVIVITTIFEIVVLFLCFTSFYNFFIEEYKVACQLIYPAISLLFLILLINDLTKGV